MNRRGVVWPGPENDLSVGKSIRSRIALLEALCLLVIAVCFGFYMLSQDRGIKLIRLLIPMAVCFLMGMRFVERPGRDYCHWLCVGLLFAAWTTLIFIIHGDHYLETSFLDLFGIFAAWAVALSFAFSKNQNGAEKGLVAVMVVYLLVSVFLSVLGLYVSFTGKTLMVPVLDNCIRLVSGRLSLGSYPNTSAELIWFGIISAVYLGIRSRKLWVCIIMGVLALGQYVAMILTASRITIVCSSSLIAIVVFAALCQDKNKRQLRFVKAGLVTVAVIAALLFLYPGTVKVQNAVIYARQEIQTEEGMYAVKTGTAVKHRELVGKSFTTGNGRTRIWSACFDIIQEKPTILLIGLKVNQLSKGLLDRSNMIGQNNISDSHSSWLQLLMLFGIPGLLPALYFLYHLLKSCINILLRLPTIHDLRPVVLVGAVIGCLAISLMESSFLTGRIRYFDFIFFLMAGFVLYDGKQSAICSKSKNIED